MSSGLDLSIPVDEDWGVSTANGDGGHAEVTFGDNASGTEVTLRGPVVRLIDLMEDALGDLIDYRIKAEGSKLDAKLATLDAKLATLQGHTERAIALAGKLVAEPLATPDEMVVGGWVRFPGEARWRCVREIAELDDTHPADRVITCDGFSWGAKAYDTLPYLSPEDFDAECDRRTAMQAQEDEAADRLQAAEWREDGAA